MLIFIGLISIALIVSILFNSWRQSIFGGGTADANMVRILLSQLEKCDLFSLLRTGNSFATVDCCCLPEQSTFKIGMGSQQADFFRFAAMSLRRCNGEM
jgi:hypothetical protein